MPLMRHPSQPSGCLAIHTPAQLLSNGPFAQRYTVWQMVGAMREELWQEGEHRVFAPPPATQ